MKAVRFHQYGGPEVLQYEDAPDPVRGPEQVLVRVKACALNRLDIWERIGPPRTKVSLPHISGSDISGVVEEVPLGREGAQEGTEVIVNPGVGCGQMREVPDGEGQPVQILRDNRERGRRRVRRARGGSQPERAPKAREDGLRAGGLGAPGLPDRLSHAGHQGGGRSAGETVLVLGAGSGVGRRRDPDCKGVTGRT